MTNQGSILSHIPNILTLLNLFCGALALHFIHLGDWDIVCVLIGIAAIADLLDGLVARGLGVSSPIGAQLDSLADMISFGLVPGMIFFTLLFTYQLNSTLSENLNMYSPTMWASIALLFPICAALRLARFNAEDDSSGDFRGLSTPAATAVVIGYLLLADPSLKGGWTAYPPLSALPPSDATWVGPEIYIFCIVLSLLMVSNISMFSLKFKGRGWKGNEMRYIFIALFIVLALAQPRAAILYIMMLYILVNTILHYYKKLTA